AVAVWQLRGSRASPAAAASALAAGLSEDRVAGVRFANTTSAAAAVAWREIRAGMAGATVSVSAAGATSRGSEGRARLSWLWRLPSGRRWAYESEVSLRYSDGAWRAVWAPQLVNSRLGKGEVLRLSVRQPPR